VVDLPAVFGVSEFKRTIGGALVITPGKGSGSVLAAATCSFGQTVRFD
jgi:hypothetical protein